VSRRSTARPTASAGNTVRSGDLPALAVPSGYTPRARAESRRRTELELQAERDLRSERAKRGSTRPRGTRGPRSSGKHAVLGPAGRFGHGRDDQWDGAVAQVAVQSALDLAPEDELENARAGAEAPLVGMNPPLDASHADFRCRGRRGNSRIGPRRSCRRDQPEWNAKPEPESGPRGHAGKQAGRAQRAAG